MKKLLLFAALTALVLAGWRLRSYSRGSFGYLLTRVAFSHFLAQSQQELDKEVASGRSNVYYFTSYYLHGLLSAYEGTGEELYLERAMGCMDVMVDKALRFKEGGRAYRVWGPFSAGVESPLPRPNLHYSFQATVPLARAAAIINADEGLRAKHGAAAKRYMAFVDDSVFRYFYRRQLRSEIPWLDPDRFPIWNDNASNLGLNAAFLCKAGGKAEHCRIAREVGLAFKGKLSPYRTGWIWENQTIPIGSDTDNTPGSVGNQAGVPDTSHANREAFLMVTLAEMGMVFDGGDLDRMAGTFADMIWNQSRENPSFANYINGSDKPYRVYKEPGLNGSVYHGWALMGPYRPKAREALLSAIAAILRGKMNPSLDRNSTSYGGKVGLAGHVLRGYKSGK